MSRLPMRLAVVSAAIALAAVAAQTTAHAAPTWQHPVVLSQHDLRSFDVEVAFAPTGGALALWQEGEPPQQGHDRRPNEVARIRERTPAGAWAPAVRLSEQGVVHGLDLEIAPSGRALAVWHRSNHPKAATESAYGFSALAPYGDPTGGDAPNGRLDVALDELGNAVAVSSPTSQRTLSVSYRSVFSAAWDKPVELDSADSISGAQVAVDRAGNAVAVWAASDGSGWSIRSARRAAATGLWSTPVGLAKMKGPAGWPALAIDGLGHAHAVWARHEEGRNVVEAARLAAGEVSWSPAVELSPPTPSALDPELAAAPSGDVLAVWAAEVERAYVVHAAFRPAHFGSWTRAVELSARGRSANQPAVALDPIGNALVAWRRFDGSREVIQAVLRPRASGVFHGPHDLGTGAAPAVALDHRANGLVAWVEGSVRASSLVAAGPILTDLSVPAQAVTGRPVALGVNATPWGQALNGSPRWDFGDGRGTVGARVLAGYPRLGRYTVTVSQADVGGGTSSLSAVVEVVAPPEPLLIAPGRGIGVLRLGLQEDAVPARLGAPASASRVRFPNRKIGVLARYPRPEGTLTVGYQGGKVVLLATSSPRDRTARGVGPGSPRAAAARLAGYRRTHAGYSRRSAGTLTVFGVRRGLVTHVSVARSGFTRP